MPAVPVVVVEEHHEAFLVWERAVAAGWLPPTGNALWHVDEHSDLCRPATRTDMRTLSADDPAGLRAFVYSELTIANFILAAAYRGRFAELTWTQHRTQQPEPVTHHVWSAGRRGTALEVSKDIRQAGVFNPDRRHVAFRTVRLGSPPATARPLALDIDLDFFSCHDGLIPCRLEVTAGEYERFRTDRLHPLRALYGSQAEAEERDGRYWLTVDLSDPQTWGSGRASDDVIRARVAALARDITAAPRPAVVTVCRSVGTGYTPADQADMIQAEVLAMLANCSPTEVRTVDELP